MVTVSVCVGSSCHLKGAEDVITGLMELIRKSGIESCVELKGCFCLGRCTEGVTIKVDDEIIASVSKESLPQVFEEKILPKAR